MSSASEHNGTASLYASPAEAMRAPAEEFLYVACLHEGTGVDKPDFLAVVDAESGADRARAADAQRRRRAASLRLEPLQLRLPRARPLASDRARASAPRGSTSIDVAERSAQAAYRDGDRARGADREDRPDPAPHRPLHAGREHRHQHARRRRRQRRVRVRGDRRQDVRGQGPLGERRAAPALQLRLLVPAAPERARLLGVRRAQRLRVRLRSRGRRQGALRQPRALLEPQRAHARSRRSSWGRRAWYRWRCAGCTTPTPTKASSAPRCRARCGASTARTARTPPTA